MTSRIEEDIFGFQVTDYDSMAVPIINESALSITPSPKG